MKSVLYEQLVNDLRNIAATRDLEAGDVTNISDAAWLIESMKSRIAELEKDAARFKWCVNQYGFADFIIHDIGKFCDTPEQMREAIDTAMQKD